MTVMNDYRTKRRYRQQKLTAEGFYVQRQQRSRARRRAEQEAIQGIVPSIEQIANPENLLGIFEDMKRHAGHAAGPDGVGYDQLGRRETGQIMRALSREILDGSFEPSRARQVRIPKSSGRGYRTLSIRSILHRVVSKAVARALTPFFDQLFLDGSHGFRPSRGPWSMLMAMEQITVDEQRFVVAQDDIRNAFDHVPIGYVMGLFRRYIDDPGLLNIVNKILRGHRADHRTVGIDQGSALSPLALNVALHHALDVPFSENAAHPPWLRCADNIVYLCQSVHEGRTAIQAAQNLLNPIGMNLKGSDGPPVDLRAGQQANILGLSIRWEGGQIQYDLTEEAWANLKRKLSETHMTENIPDRAIQVIKGWTESGGPAFENKSEGPILTRVQEVAAEAGHREELSRRQLSRYLQSARDRWVSRKRNARKVNRAVIGERVQEGAVAPPTADRPGISICPRLKSSQGIPAAALAPK